MQKAEKRMVAILRRAKQAGVSTEAMTTIVSTELSKNAAKNSQKLTYFPKITEWKKTVGPISLITIGLVVAVGRSWISGAESQCLIKMPFDETKVFRKPEDCSLCRGVIAVDRVTNISQRDFDKFYASRAKPVIVTDGTKDWSAPDVFGFDYFKSLYEKFKGEKTHCQFFPYKTEFDSLREALNMSEARSRLEPGTKEWYIGWSNCNDQAGRELRKHYKRPCFLPDVSENMALSWIFMGGPGEGAHMHVDNVRYASWQAQLRGRKKWRLAPPPECYYACVEFSAVVEPGEIIVVDTNRWYHQTHILPGDISITIGTEFD